MTLQYLLQELSSEDARQALQHIGTAPHPGGTIYIVGFILDDARRSSADAVDFNPNCINLYDTGESYTASEYYVRLCDAGFVDIAHADFSLVGGKVL